jgi:hypothetical protein
VIVAALENRWAEDKGPIRKKSCLFPAKEVSFKKQELCMGVRIKPVEPTVIKDKAIIKKVIEEIRRRPTKAALAKQKKHNDIIMSMVRKCPE